MMLLQSGSDLIVDQTFHSFRCRVHSDYYPFGFWYLEFNYDNDSNELFLYNSEVGIKAYLGLVGEYYISRDLQQDIRLYVQNFIDKEVDWFDERESNPALLVQKR